MPQLKGDSEDVKERMNSAKPGDHHNIHYLPFVDGLRAVSILAVVGCHLGIPGFAGGFVGVDVFFVISGFLIINQIRSELERGTFSILSFYARRTLRIHPPFLIVLLSVFVVAPFILPTPSVYYDFALSAALAPMMLTNVLFYIRQGYFDITAHEKPLLHTWTLSVEEQFYLIAPVLLLLIFRLGKGRFGAIAASIAFAVCALSFIGSIEKTTAIGRNAAFYLVQWRMWEFILGGVIGYQLIAVIERAPRIVAEIMGIVGGACLVFAIVSFDSTTLFPSWRALAPAGGAALVILSGVSQPQIFAARLLAVRWMVAIGLVSYAWYLWHWPIISFMRISRLDESSLLYDCIGGGVIGLLLAIITYRYVELPIRRWRKTSELVRRPGIIFSCLLYTSPSPRD